MSETYTIDGTKDNVSAHLVDNGRSQKISVIVDPAPPKLFNHAIKDAFDTIYYIGPAEGQGFIKIEVIFSEMTNKRLEFVSTGAPIEQEN